MSIVPLQKVTLCGVLAEKTETLEHLQGLGCLHLVSLRPPPEEPETSPPERPEAAYQALKYLLDCPDKRRPLHEDSVFDVDEFVERVLHNRQLTRHASDRRDFLRKRVQEVEPWGDFRFPPLEDLAGFRLWFYRVPHYKMKQVSAEGLVWQVVRGDHRNCYVVVVAEDEPPSQAMPVPRIHVGALSLSELKRRLEKVEIELEDLAAERQALTRWMLLLTRNLARAEDQASLNHAAAQTLDRDGVFAVQGWAPVRDLPRIRNFAERQGIVLLAEDPEPSDLPPTLLDNPENVAGGEEVVAFYQMPAYRSWDPSPVIFFSFAGFFAMILADAGYAALFGLLLVLFRKRLGKSKEGRRIATMGLVIVGVSVVYGVLAGSYFGVAPAPDSALASLWIIQLDDFDGMMRLAVVIGVLHLMIAQAVIAWRQRARPSALAPLGWIAVLCGGLLLWYGDRLGGWLLGIGSVAVFLFSSERAVHEPLDLLWRGLDGLLALTGLSKAFGDVLSYLRLFALGLASTSLALTFNQLAFGVIEAVPGVGVLLGILILLLGHLLNFVLSVVSGVVHGLRLNLIEFYHWGVSDEGYPFKAFAKKEPETWTI